LTSFDEARLYGGDPTYAPGLSWTGKHPRWKSPKKYVDAGYEPRSVSLTPTGSPDDEHQRQRARQCREHTIALLKWWNGRHEASQDFGKWSYVIRRFRTDPVSPYADVKANTRANYDYCLDKWEKVIGHMGFGDIDWTSVRTIEKAMLEKGYSHAHVHRMMNRLRAVAKYGGYALRIPEVRETSEALSNMRFRSPVARSIAPTREQVYAIIAEAEKDGNLSAAVGFMMQFELSLRAVDVRGQWLKTDGKEGGIVRNGQRWQDGLTWEMFAPDLGSFTKTISKTEKSSPEPLTFDLTPLPDLIERLHTLRRDRRTGPVVVSERHRLPYTAHGWASAFRRYRDAAEVPRDITAMDLRAGGITEAKNLGADPYSLRDAAQHRQITTTDRYSRSRSENVSKVVTLRQTNRK